MSELDFRRRFEAALGDGARELGFEAQLEHLPRFVLLAEEVLAHNARLGLTRIVDPSEMAAKHFLDSLCCLRVPCWNAVHEAVDVGSGAGFPGLVLAVAVPDCHFVLLEASRKKSLFLQRASALLGVDVEVVGLRAEHYGRQDLGRDRFDVGFCRAVARLSVALEYVVPLLRRGGSFVAQVGPGDGQSLEGYCARRGRGEGAGPPAWEVLASELDVVTKFRLPGGAGRRWLARFRKAGVTPKAFPRRTGIPARRPLPLFGR